MVAIITHYDVVNVKHEVLVVELDAVELEVVGLTVVEVVVVELHAVERDVVELVSKVVTFGVVNNLQTLMSVL